MTEEDLDGAIVQLCDGLGLTTLHVREPRRERGEWPGFPDRIIFGPRPPYVLYRELKASTGLSGDQKRWQWRLGDWCHQDYGVWRAADWHSGRIAEELAALAGRDVEDAEAGGEEDPDVLFRRVYYGGKRKRR